MAVVMFPVASTIPRSAETDEVERKVNPSPATGTAASQVMRFGGEFQVAFAEFTLTQAAESVHESFIDDAHARSS